MDTRPFIRISPKDNLAAEMYRQEQAVAVYLAKHVASLIENLNGGIATDWRTIYESAHYYVSEERHEEQ